jgi:hypothetical protein
MPSYAKGNYGDAKANARQTIPFFSPPFAKGGGGDLAQVATATMYATEVKSPLSPLRKGGDVMPSFAKGNYGDAKANARQTIPFFFSPLRKGGRGQCCPVRFLLYDAFALGACFYWVCLVVA